MFYIILSRGRKDFASGIIIQLRACFGVGGERKRVIEKMGHLAFTRSFISLSLRQKNSTFIIISSLLFARAFLSLSLSSPF